MHLAARSQEALRTLQRGSDRLLRTALFVVRSVARVRARPQQASTGYRYPRNRPVFEASDLSLARPLKSFEPPRPLALFLRQFFLAVIPRQRGTLLSRDHSTNKTTDRTRSERRVR